MRGLLITFCVTVSACAGLPKAPAHLQLKCEQASAFVERCENAELICYRHYEFEFVLPQCWPRILFEDKEDI